MLGQAVFLLPVLGLAIQRTLQICDPLIGLLIDYYFKLREKNGRPVAVSETDTRKAFLAILSVFLGLFVALITKLNLWAEIPGEAPHVSVRIIITAIILSAGSQGTNSVVKYLDNVRKASKPELPEANLKATPRSIQAGQKIKLSQEDPSKLRFRVLSGPGKVSGNGVFSSPTTVENSAITKVQIIDALHKDRSSTTSISIFPSNTSSLPRRQNQMDNALIYPDDINLTEYNDIALNNSYVLMTVCGDTSEASEVFDYVSANISGWEGRFIVWAKVPGPIQVVVDALDSSVDPIKTTDVLGFTRSMSLVIRHILTETDELSVQESFLLAEADQ